MKKITALFLTVAMVFSLTACGESKKTSGGENTENTTSAESKTTESETTKNETSENESPFTTKDEVSVVFDKDKVTIVYRGTPTACLYDYIDTDVYQYVKLYFTYKEESMSNAGVFMLETLGVGEMSTLLQFGDYKLKDGVVIFGENGFPMTCVFTATEEEISGIISNIDMDGKLKVNDSLYNNYYVAYVKDAVTIND